MKINAQDPAPWLPCAVFTLRNIHLAPLRSIYPLWYIHRALWFTLRLTYHAQYIPCVRFTLRPIYPAPLFPCGFIYHAPCVPSTRCALRAVDLVPDLTCTLFTLRPIYHAP